MTEQKTIRAKTPADLLAVVPYVLGFHPEDSLVMLSLPDANRPFHARVDLPVDADEVVGTAGYLAASARQHGVRSAVVVAYSDDEELAETAAGALLDRLRQDRVRVVTAFRADGERWYPLGESPGGPGGPSGGTPYDVSGHPLTLEAVLDGRVTYASREELRDSLVGGDPDEVEAVERAADMALVRLQAACRHPLGPSAPEQGRRHLVAEGHWVARRVQRFLGDGLRLSVDDVGRMLVAMVWIEVRDVAWAQMRPENATRHVDLWRDVVRRCPLDLLAAPAALLGFAAWLSGDGALAWCAVDRCQEAEPDYSLAGLLAQALAGAVPPSSWRPFDPDDLTLFAG